MPTPIAAVAAAMARGQPREAANAAHAEPSRGVLSEASRADAAPAGATLTGTDIATAANSAPPMPPAYGSGPPRTRLAAALVGGLVAVTIALAAVALWRGGRSADITPGQANESATATGATPALAPPRAPAETPPAAEGQATREDAASLPPVPAATNPAPGSAAPSTELPPTAATSDAASAPVEIKALPPHAPARRSARRSAPDKTASPPPTAPAAAPSAPPAPPPIAQARSAAPAPTAARVATRWQHLDEELSRCTRADFITRVICGQRARFRYCDGYWGKVPQCPGNPVQERGQ